MDNSIINKNKQNIKILPEFEVYDMYFNKNINTISTIIKNKIKEFSI